MEKRLFTRVIYSNPALLMQEENVWRTQLIDLSFKGALFDMPEQFSINEREYELIFKLSASDVDIKMVGVLTHINGGHVGMRCNHMDIDSMTHLRRLIELNVGDDLLLNRELENLSHPQP